MTLVEALIAALTALAGSSVLLWRHRIMAFLRSPRGQRVLHAALTDNPLHTPDNPNVRLEPETLDAKTTLGFVLDSTNDLVLTQGEIFGRLEERYEKRISDADTRIGNLEKRYDKLRLELNDALIKLATAEGELRILRSVDGQKDKLIAVQTARIAELEAERDVLRRQIDGLEARIERSRTHTHTSTAPPQQTGVQSS